MSKLNLDKVKKRLHKVNPKIDGIYEFCGLGLRQPKPPAKPPVKPPARTIGYVPKGFDGINLSLEMYVREGSFVYPEGAPNKEHIHELYSENIAHVNRKWSYGVDEYSSLGTAWIDLRRDKIRVNYVWGAGGDALSYLNRLDWPTYDEFPYPKYPSSSNYSFNIPGFHYVYPTMDLYIADLEVESDGVMLIDDPNAGRLKLSNGAVDAKVSDVNLEGMVWSDKWVEVYSNYHDGVGDEYFSIPSLQFDTWRDLDLDLSIIEIRQADRSSKLNTLRNQSYNGDSGHLEASIAGEDAEMFTRIKIKEGIDIDITSSYVYDGIDEYEVEASDEVIIEDLVSIAMGIKPSNVNVVLSCRTNDYPSQYKDFTYSLSDVIVDGPNLRIPIANSNIASVRDIKVDVEYRNIDTLKLSVI